MIELGQTVGNYRVVAKLGEGGMGAVFLAEHPIIGRKAALKVIHPQHARNPEVVARFVNEATAINRVGHPHIVEVTDFGRTPGGDFYFAMEYLEGRSLSDIVAAEAPLPPARALAIAAQIADALGASHAHGVIHRDLKPENVFVVARGDEKSFVKVLDFGLAKLVNGDGAPHETRAGVIMGTPYYMSPEQCDARREVDHRADVYALGVVLFEMLTGHLPFGGADYGEVLMKHLAMRPPSARSLVPELPEALDALLQRALSKSPDERFATMELFRQALLEPAAPAETHAASWLSEDLSQRMRAARPMPRAEISRRRRLAAVPTRIGPARPATRHFFDRTVDRVPRYRGPRTVAALAVAALIAGAIAAGIGHASDLRRSVSLAPRAVLAAAMLAAPAAPSLPVPDTVPLTFGSDPDGALVVDADGTAVGHTPLSIRVPRSEQPARYRFEMLGFVTKEMESIPNVASSMFARLEPAAQRSSAASTARERRARAAARFQRSLDEDGVMPPAFGR